MTSAKHNSTMERDTGLISLLFDVASSRDVPFHQASLCYLCPSLCCVPVLFADNAKGQFVKARCGFPMALSHFSPTFSGFTEEKVIALLFIYITLCNKWSIATNEAKWPPHFSERD